MNERLRWLVLKGWPLVMLAAACGGAVGYLIAFGGHPTYTSHATLHVAPPVSTSASDAVMGDQYADNRTQLYVQLIKSDEVAKRVAAELQTSEPLHVLTANISAIGLHLAPLLEIEARGSSPEAARSLAQAYVDQLPEFARSVEENSGLREGPVLVLTAGPTEATGSTTGLRPWFTVLFATVVFGGAASAYVMRNRSEHPTVRNLKALRTAMPASFVEEIGDDPADLLRIQAMLFAAPNSDRRVIFATSRRADGLEAFTGGFTRSLLSVGIPCEHVKAGELAHLHNGVHSTGIVVFDAPAILEDSHRIAGLASHCRTAIIVARGAGTLVEDVVESGRLLGLNCIGVKGVIITRRVRWNGVKRPAIVDPLPDEGAETLAPNTNIDMQEVAMGSRIEGRNR